jgi:hypothetical protein
MMTKPTISHLDPEFIRNVRKTLKNIKKNFFSEARAPMENAPGNHHERQAANPYA